MNNNSLIPDEIAGLLSAYVKKSAVLAELESKLSFLKSQIKDDRDLIFGKDIAAILGWTDLPKREDKKEESDD